MTESTALSPSTKALLADPNKALGELRAKFPRDLQQSEAAREFVAVSLTYDLDPFMGDIVPYQGRPFVTEQGWLRLIGRHAPSQLIRLTARQASDAERQEINCPAGDFLAIAEVHRKYPNGELLPVIRRGRVTAAESKGLSMKQESRGHTPVEKEPYEMAETRARRRALRTAFRDVLTAQGLSRFVDEETGEVLEGTAVRVEGDPVLPEAASGPVETPKQLMDEATKRARSELYAKASEAKIVTRGALHAILKLSCNGQPPERHTDADGPPECHALREGIDKMIAGGASESESWEKMKETLVSSLAPPEPGPPGPGADGVVAGDSSEGQAPEGPAPEDIARAEQEADGPEAHGVEPDEEEARSAAESTVEGPPPEAP